LLENTKRRIFTDVLDNKAQYLLLVFFLVVGITAGTFTVSNLQTGTREALESYRNSLFISVKSTDPNFWGIFFHSLLNHTLIFGIIAIFSMMILGIPVIAATLIFKGFCVGFTVGVLALDMSFGGFLAIVVCTFLPNLVLIPCICKAGVLGFNNAIQIFKMRHIPKTPHDKLMTSRPYLIKMLAVYLFGLLGVLIESLLTPALMKLI
jgi:stage II sporulation protein M